MAMSMECEFIAQFFSTSFTFWGHVIDFYQVSILKEEFTPSAFSRLSLEKLAFGAVQHWVFAQSLAPVE